MEKKDCEARTLTALGVGVGFGVIIGAALLASFYPMFQSEKWAAWVQAIGSVLAIFTAVILYFLGERHKQKSKESEEANHVTHVMKSVELLSFTLVSTMDHLYDKHLEYGVKGDLPGDEPEKGREAYQAANVIRGVWVTFEDFCERRSIAIDRCGNSISSIEWSKPPIAIIGIYLVSISNDFHLFSEWLKGNEERDRKREKLRRLAENVSKNIIEASNLLEKSYGYRSDWPYISESLSWVK